MTGTHPVAADEEQLCALLERSAADGTDVRSAIASLFLRELARHAEGEASAIADGGDLGPTVGDAPPVVAWASRHREGPLVAMTEGPDAMTVAINHSAAFEVSPACVRQAELRATVRAAAVVTGWSSRATSIAAERAYARTLGGSPLIEFQAARHRLARCALAVSRARFEVADAAAALGAGEARSRWLVLTALATALDVALSTTRGLAQLQGASGTADGEPFKLYRSAHDAVAGLGPVSALWTDAARAASSAPGEDYNNRCWP